MCALFLLHKNQRELKLALLSDVLSILCLILAETRLTSNGAAIDRCFFLYVAVFLLCAVIDLMHMVGNFTQLFLLV